jgi:hypothetical protein
MALHKRYGPWFEGDMTTGEEEAYVCKKLNLATPPPPFVNLENTKGGMDFSWLPDLPNVVLPAAPAAVVVVPKKKAPQKKKKQPQPAVKKVKETPKNTLLGFIQYIAAHVFFGAKALKEMPPPDVKKDSPALYADKMMIQNALCLFNEHKNAQVWELVCEKIKSHQNPEMLSFVQLLKDHKDLVLSGNMLKIPSINRELQLTSTHVFIFMAVHMSLHLAYYIKNLIDKAIENDDMDGHGMSSGWELLAGKGNASKDDFSEWNTEETQFAANIVHIHNVLEEIKKWK